MCSASRYIMVSMCPPAPKPERYNWNNFEICNQISQKLSEKKPSSTRDYLPSFPPSDSSYPPSFTPSLLLSYRQEINYCDENKHIHEVSSHLSCSVKTETSVSTLHTVTELQTPDGFVTTHIEKKKEPIFWLTCKTYCSEITHKIVKCRPKSTP